MKPNMQARTFEDSVNGKISYGNSGDLRTFKDSDMKSEIRFELCSSNTFWSRIEFAI